jgi:hypothetical protein
VQPEIDDAAVFGMPIPLGANALIDSRGFALVNACGVSRSVKR